MVTQNRSCYNTIVTSILNVNVVNTTSLVTIIEVSLNITVFKLIDADRLTYGLNPLLYFIIIYLHFAYILKMYISV